MPDYKKASGFIQNRRNQLKESLSTEKSILELPNNESVGEERTESVASPIKEPDTNVPHNDLVGQNGPNELEAKNCPGRPRRKSAVLRNIAKSIKFDEATNRRLQMLKIDYKFDQQDIVYLAVLEYLEKYFPKGKAKAEDVQYIKQLMADLNG